MSLLSEKLNKIVPDEELRSEPLAATRDLNDGLREVIAGIKEMLAEQSSAVDVDQIILDLGKAQLIAFETLLKHDGNYTAAIQALEEAIEHNKNDGPSLKLSILFIERLHAEGQEKINSN